MNIVDIRNIDWYWKINIILKYFSMWDGKNVGLLIEMGMLGDCGGGDGGGGN